MNIELDQDALNKATASVVQESVVAAIKSWTSRNEIEKHVSMGLAAMPIGEMITEALAKVEWQRMTEGIAREIERTVAAATCRVLQENSVAMVLRMRGVTYDADKKAPAVWQELFGKKKGDNDNA